MIDSRLVAPASALALALLPTLAPAPAEAAKPTPAKPAPAAKPSPSPSPSPTPTPDDLDLLMQQLDADATPAPGASAVPLPLPSQFSSTPTGAFGLGMGSNIMNPNISVITDVAAAAFSGPNLQVGAHDPKHTGFNLQQVELSLNSPVDPFLRYDSNIVFSQFGVEIEEAYATTTALPLDLQARAGQFLTRFGRANTTHPHSWDFADQPLVLGKFMGGEGNHGLGAELSWLAPLPWYTEVVGSVTEAAGGGTARSFYGNDDLGVRSPLDLQGTASLRQFYFLHRDWSLACGLSAMTGPNPTGRANRSDILGADLYLKYRPLEQGSFTIVALTAEAMQRRRQVPAGLLVDHGGYGALSWHIAQQWGAALRYDLATGTNTPGVVDYLDPDWTGDRGKWTANVTFWPTEFSRLRLQGSMDKPSWQPVPTYATFLTIETVIGAHGAHKF